MSKAVLREAESYTVEWDSEIEAVVHTWEAFTSGREFRDGCEALLEALQERGASKLLVDTREIQAHDDEDKRWMQQEWTPRLAEAGAECTATVRSDSVIAEMDVEDLTEELDGTDHTMMVTDDLDEARSWLAEQ